jgi:hypothetical protein
MPPQKQKPIKHYNKTTAAAAAAAIIEFSSVSYQRFGGGRGTSAIKRTMPIINRRGHACM